MELSLGLFFLTVLSLSAVSVECRNLQDQNGERRSSNVCPCSKRKHVHSKVDRPEHSAQTVDLPNEYLRQSYPSRTVAQQVTGFLEGERCGCGCRKHVRGTTTSERVATTTEEISDQTTGVAIAAEGISASTTGVATTPEEISAPTTDLPTITDMTASDPEDNTIINDTSPTTTEVSPLKFNTTCTDAECLTVVSSPDKADVTLRFRCTPPRNCGSQKKAQSHNVNKEEKINTGAVTHSDKISAGGDRKGGGGGEKAQGSSGHSSDHNTHGFSSYGLSVHQSSSGYSLPGRHTASSSSYVITGDHTDSFSSHSTTEDHTYSSSSEVTTGYHTYSSVSHSNKGSKHKCCTSRPHTSTPPPESTDSKPINSAHEPGNGGLGKPSYAGMGGGSKPAASAADLESTVNGGKGSGAKPSGGYGGMSGAKPAYSAFAASSNYPQHVPTTQRTTTTGPLAKEQNSLPAPPNCGVFNETLFRRIKGGAPSTVGKWPWMVVYGYGPSDGEVAWMCGGALVTAKSSITAAHCLDHPSRKLRLARFGDLDLDDDDDGANHITEEVLRGIKHPLFNTHEYNHDIGIVVLKHPLTFTDTIKPICLPFGKNMRNEEFKGMEPYIAGWGLLDFRTGSNSMLYEAQVPVVPNTECAKTYGERLNKVIRNDHICAGGGGADTCQGDSGGPLMVPWNHHFYTIGVVSWGFRCGSIGYPGVYTRITSYLDWLRTNLV